MYFQHKITHVLYTCIMHTHTCTYTDREIELMPESTLAIPLSELMKKVPNTCSSLDAIKQVAKCFPIFIILNGHSPDQLP